MTGTQPDRTHTDRCLAVILAGSFLLLGSWPAPGRGEDWPQFLGPNRNATSSEKGLLQSWPGEGPPLVWEKKIGKGFSAPVVAGERLILFHRVDDKEIVDCLDAATGKERWRFAYPTRHEDQVPTTGDDGPRSTPLIAGNRVYTLGAEGKLHCLELDTGKRVWDRAINTEYQVRPGFFGTATSPILEGNRLLINVGGKGAGIVAFDKESGKELWKATDHEASYSSPVAATIDGARQVCFFTREGIVLLDPEKGTVHFTQRWRARIHASVNAAAPVVAGEQVFFSASYNTGAIVLRIRKDGADEVWKGDDILSNHYNTTVHRDGFLYGIEGRQEGGGAELRCVELRTGKVRWRKERFGCAALLLVEGNLVALSESGALLLIEASPDGYKEKARAPVLARPCRADMALANGRLFARDATRLICLGLKK